MCKNCKGQGTYVFFTQRANEQTYRLMVRDYRHPWTPTTPEASQVRYWPFGDKEGMGDWLGYGFPMSSLIWWNKVQTLSHWFTMRMGHHSDRAGPLLPKPKVHMYCINYVFFYATVLRTSRLITNTDCTIGVFSGLNCHSNRIHSSLNHSNRSLEIHRYKNHQDDRGLARYTYYVSVVELFLATA